MFALSRRLARRLRAVLSRTTLGLPQRAPIPPLVFEAIGRGTCARYHDEGLAVQCDLPETVRPDSALCLPLDALVDVEGSDGSLVVLEAHAPCRTVARWSVGGVAQSREYGVPPADRLAPFPSLGAVLAPVPPTLLGALADAQALVRDAGDGGGQRGIWLDGRGGAVMAAGGGQLLVRSGFALPWPATLPVRSTPLWLALASKFTRPLALAMTGDGTVTIRADPWTILLAPPSDAAPPPGSLPLPEAGGRGCLRLHPADRRALERALPESDRAGPAAVLDLSVDVCVVLLPSDPEANGSASLVLRRSTYAGPAIRLATDRVALARALQLRLQAFAIDPGNGSIVGLAPLRGFAWRSPDRA